MLWDYQAEYASSGQSSCPSMSTSSFGSNATCDTSDITPPPSTRRSSLDSSRLEDIGFSLAHTAKYLRTSSTLPSIFSNDTGPRLMDQSIAFPNGQLMQDQPFFTFSNIPKYNDADLRSFQSYHGLNNETPDLEMDLISPISGVETSLGSIDFVDPTQTNLISAFDAHSPMSRLRGIHFESPASDYDSNCTMDLSSITNMAFHLQYNEYKSASTAQSPTSPTPCRISTTRQPRFEVARSSATLKRTQAESRAIRHTRKRLHHDLSSGMIPSNIRIQHAADKPCTWPRCDKKFKRQEHLKRHEWTVHLNQEIFPCEFCGHPFNRRDNLKSHMRLHTDPLNAKRTKYFPRAKSVFDSMDCKKKKTPKTNDRVKATVKVKIEGRPKPRLPVTG